MVNDMDIKEKIWIKFYRLKKFIAPTKISSREYVRFLKLNGLSIGEGTYFFDPARTIVDVQRPWMLKIGNFCKITSNCTILAHDYSYSVLRRSHNDIIGGAKRTCIGNNVFLGIGTIVCMGADIGDNVIIGAGSVVTGPIPSNSVAAGNPARVICSLDDFYVKRKAKVVNEAKEYAYYFNDKYGTNPSESQMELFFSLFLPRKDNILKECAIRTALSGDDEYEVIDTFYSTNSIFDGLDDFLNSINNNRTLSKE